MLKTGVYLDWHRHSAVVVRIKDGTVVYLTMNETVIERFGGKFAYMPTKQHVALCQTSDSRFAHQFDIFLPSYPILRAVKAYWRSGLDVTPEAKKVMQLILLNNKTRREATV